MRRTLSGLLLSLVALPAFAQAPVLPTSRVVGGVTLLEHRADAFARAPKLTIDPKPLVTIGGPKADPAFDLEYAFQFITLSDGSIATMPRIGPSLRLFGPGGAPQKVIGKLGEGPGDFMRPTGLLLLAGDTLFTVDEGNFRANWITTAKGVVKTAPLLQDYRNYFGLDAVGLIGPSRIVWVSNMISSTRTPVGKRFRLLTPVTISSPLRDKFTFIDSIPGFEVVSFRTNYRNRVDSSQVLVRFGMQSHLATWESTVVLANLSTSYALERRSETGKVVSRITIPVSRTPVTKAMRDAAIALDLEKLEGLKERMVDPAESRRQARETPFADSLPPIGGIAAAPDQTLWVLDGVATRVSNSWDATQFRSDGAIIGRLHFEGKGIPVYFGKNSVLVRTVDDDGIVTITSYRIVPAK